jgi:hypothetical protein
MLRRELSCLICEDYLCKGCEKKGASAVSMIQVGDSQFEYVCDHCYFRTLAMAKTNISRFNWWQFRRLVS